MNKRIGIIFIFFILLMFLSSCSTNFEKVEVPIRPELASSEADKNNPELGIQSVIEEEDYQTIAVHYPVTGYEEVDSTLSAFASNSIELFRQETANTYRNHEDNWPYELHIEYEIVFKTSRHLSILFRESKYLGGPQSISTIYTFNFNLEESEELALKDLFKSSPTYLEIISRYVYDQLMANNVLGVKLERYWVIQGTAALESNYKHFLFTEGGIIVMLEKNQVGPASIGEPQIFIPFEVFTAHIDLKEAVDDLTEVATTEQENIQNDLSNDDHSKENSSTGPSASEVETSEKADAITVTLGRKKIALTFEGGPDPVFTPLILDTLKSRNKVATFFLLGIRVNDYPAMAKRIVTEGHSIGNLSWSHPQLTRLTKEELLNQLDKTQSIISKTTGYLPYIYRPTYGIYNENVINDLQMPAILWSIDPSDLKYQDSGYITNYVLDHAFDGAIIRFHDTSTSTTQALSAILDGLIADGYDIVSVNELLNLSPETKTENVRIYSQTLDNN
ncbi:polysaccharide deacetylase family protein [Fusibacter bizertensis]